MGQGEAETRASEGAGGEGRPVRILFLDDAPGRRQSFLARCPSAVACETAAEAIRHLRTGSWALVCLDHDLGGEVYVDSSDEETGAAVVRAIVAERLPIERVAVHSLNTPAAERMVADLRAAGYRAERRPWIWVQGVVV